MSANNISEAGAINRYQGSAFLKLRISRLRPIARSPCLEFTVAKGPPPYEKQGGPFEPPWTRNLHRKEFFSFRRWLALLGVNFLSLLLQPSPGLFRC